MVYSTEVILWPRDFVGIDRTVIVTGTTGVTVRSSMVENSTNPADYTVAEDTVMVTGNYPLRMQTPLKFTPAAGTTFRVV
jgi:hypothetical protein